jgi:hypothetical protein
MFHAGRRAGDRSDGHADRNEEANSRVSKFCDST